MNSHYDPCDKCDKPIIRGQHYFEVYSYHQESSNSWDTRKKVYHVDCAKNVSIAKEFEWHIKGEY